MQAKTLCVPNTNVLDQQLSTLITNDFQPTLAIIFSSTKQSLGKIQALFSKKNIQLIGCTSAGEIANKELLDGGIVGLLLDIHPDYFTVSIEQRIGKSAYEAAFVMGQNAMQQFQHPALVVMSSGVHVNADEIIMGFKDVLPDAVPVFGGLASDDLALQKTSVFNNEQVYDEAILSLVLDNEKIEVKGLAASGWQAVGTTNTITKADGNMIYTINDQPALDIFLKYFGFFDNLNIQGKPITTISAQYPLQILRKNGHHVLRSPIVGNEEDRSLMLAGGVKTGDQFRFSISPGFEVIDQTVDAFKQLKEQTHEADALILFSCKGRHAALGPMIEDEISGIYDHWQKPMIGFFSYGEIGADFTGQRDFHNETCSLIVLRER